MGKSDSRSGYNSARDSFWELVRGESDEAVAVRSILEEAGYSLEGTTGAPVLRMNWDHAEEDKNRARMDRTLSIDHANPGSIAEEENPKAWLATENMRFMSLKDNSERGDKYDELDKLVRPKEISEGRLQRLEDWENRLRQAIGKTDGSDISKSK